MDDPVALATACFRRCCAGDRVLEHAIAGLHLVLRQPANADASAVAGLRAATFDAAPAIAAAVESRIDAGTVWLGLAAAAAIAGPPCADDPLMPDRIAWAGLLAARLTVELHRSRIAGRGDPLMRYLAIRRAEATPRGFAVLH